MFKRGAMFAILSLSMPLQAKVDPDWSAEAVLVPGENRQNIYQVTREELEVLKNDGYIHAMKYPIKVTGVLIPYKPLLKILKSEETSPLRELVFETSGKSMGFKTESDLYEWMGLSKHNGPNAVGIYKMPYPNGKPDQFYAGAGLVKTANGEGLTFSCFACHANSMFGTTVMGLTNKRPRANKAFHYGRMLLPKVPDLLFRATGASEGEVAMFARSKKNILAVDGVVPQVLGLDTSLPHVTLSLARRNEDEYATKSPVFEKHPRENELSHFVADSKPMPWWNLKYKTRWLSDGSVVSGNPIFTNILWNEIGRGTDLKELEQWMKDNKKTVEEITAAVFATEAPRYTDFFPASSIDIEKAKRGEQLFNQTCVKCHGEYQKAWSQANASDLSRTDLLATTKVIYHDKTPIKNVGTDPQRFQATKYFADTFNNLAISKWMETVIEPQEGYVPPPLVGIWARYPYFHNGSVPTLCAVLSQEADRPQTFVMGPAVNKELDFDRECVGYPVGKNIPKSWLKDKEAAMDTRKPGLRNIGHTKMLLDENGKEKFSAIQKREIVEFLKTL